VRWIPNGLSLIRLICAPMVASLIVSGEEKLALYGVMGAFFTDLLDGWLARKYSWETPMGRILDPLADKALSFCIFGALYLCQKIPLSLCIIILIRDVCIGLGAWWMGYKKDIQYFKPLMISKVNTATQGLLCVAVLWGGSPALVGILIPVLWSTTILSFYIYGNKLWTTWR
jgi:cardiolipin synthase